VRLRKERKEARIQNNRSHLSTPFCMRYPHLRLAIPPQCWVRSVISGTARILRFGHAVETTYFLSQGSTEITAGKTR
jgi:hypothetical protein